MKIKFPTDPYDGQIFYSPSTSRVFRYDKPVDVDGERITDLDGWEDITDVFVNNPTNPNKDTQGEK